MTDLKSSQREQLKTLLLHLHNELTEQLEISKHSADVVTLDQTAVGRVSRMDAMQQQSMAQTTRAKARESLNKYMAALAYSHNALKAHAGRSTFQASATLRAGLAVSPFGRGLSQSGYILVQRLLSLKLKKVEAALQGISNNKYGSCKQCDETIAYERLLAQPETKFCLSCQEKTDHQQ